MWPLSESNRIDSGGGTYLLPGKVSCSGCFVSVHICFFYNDKGNRSHTKFRLLVGVFKQMGDNYLLDTDKCINIDAERDNSSKAQGCESKNFWAPVPVREGYRIAVHVKKKCQKWCPLEPNLKPTRPTSVFFIRSRVTTIPVSQVNANESYTNVYLDVRASIGTFNGQQNKQDT